MKDDDFGDGGSADDDDYADGEGRWKEDCLTLWCYCNRSEKSPSSRLELQCPGT